MPYGIYISAEGAHAQSKRLEVLSNNLANVDTPGFKRELAVFQARYSEATAQGHDYPGSGTENDISGGVWFRETARDMSPGRLQTTGAETDMAIDGDGFFVVRRGDQDMLTRAGNFMLNSAGTLMTQQGYPVMSEAGTPITIDPALGPWSVSRDGAVVQAGVAQPLALVRARNPGDLVKAGENLFSPLAKPVAVPPAERRIQAGYLELSGVKPTQEMMELIEASRAFEANTNMIKNQDQMLGNLLGRAMKSI